MGAENLNDRWIKNGLFLQSLVLFSKQATGKQDSDINAKL